MYGYWIIGDAKIDVLHDTITDIKYLIENRLNLCLKSKVKKKSRIVKKQNFKLISTYDCIDIHFTVNY